jgi:glutamyl-tRNA synthetase
MTDLASLMFPAGLQTRAEWEAAFPARDLPAGARITRFGPSPTGYLHIGGVYAALIAQDLARNSGGRYFIRIENTDVAREDPDALRQFGEAFRYFGIESDEGAGDPWGPYVQGEREAIYASCARSLVEAGKAYPCFCTQDELEALTARQKAASTMPGYYGEWATCRTLDSATAAERIAAGEAYVVRFRAPDGPAGRVCHPDQIRGELEQNDNRNDAVILKNSTQSPRLPTYHFAHVVDDHYMRVNLVTRGEEWIPSLPLHMQLFEALGWPAPDYAHIAPLMKIDGSSKRKLSKRKDPEASVEYYMTSGYPAASLRIYLRGLANGNLADIDFAEALATPLQLDRMGVAGPVFDEVKLQSISREYIAEMTPAERVAAFAVWAKEFDPEAAALLEREEAQLLKAFELERQIDKNPRKDVAAWRDVLPNYRVFLPSAFAGVSDPAHPDFEPTSPDLVRAVTADYLARYNHGDDRDTWFDGLRAIARDHGFATTTGDYKRNPEAFVGPIAEASNIIRVGLTGARRSPDLYLVSQVIGEEEARRRLGALLD